MTHPDEARQRTQRLERSGVDPTDVGGSDEALEALLAELIGHDVLEATVEGTLRLSSGFATELGDGVATLASEGGPAFEEVIRAGLNDRDDEVERLLGEWASPIRLATARAIAARVDLNAGALIAASELTARLSLSGLLASVVWSQTDPATDEQQAEVDPEQLLALLLHTGVASERLEDGLLELTPAFVDARGHQRERARAWKAAERRELLGELLLVQDHELSEAFRLAGFPDSVSELLALHRFTALTSLPLWTAWQTLSAFERPFERVDGATFDEWLTGEVVVMVSSPSSSPSQQLEAVVAEAVRGQGRPVAVIDADDERELCERLEVDRPPMVLLLRDGAELHRTRWSSSALELRLLIDETFDPDAAAQHTALPIVTG